MLQVSLNQQTSPSFQAKLSINWLDRYRINNLISKYYKEEMSLPPAPMTPETVFASFQDAFEKATLELPGEVKITGSRAEKRCKKMRFFSAEYIDKNKQRHALEMPLSHFSFLPDATDKTEFARGIRGLVLNIACSAAKNKAGTENPLWQLHKKLARIEA